MNGQVKLPKKFNELKFEINGKKMAEGKINNITKRENELYFDIFLSESPTFQYNDVEYKIPEQVTIECYEEVRNTIGEKVYGKNAITDEKVNSLQEKMEGKEFKFALFPVKVEANKLKVFLLVENKYEKDGEIYYPFCGIVWGDSV